MADIIQQRRDTAARWAQYNPILLEGEVGYVTDNPNQYKIGNGRDKWNDLPLRGYTGTITQDTGDDENAVMSQKAVTDKLTELGSYKSYNYTKNDYVNSLIKEIHIEGVKDESLRYFVRGCTRFFGNSGAAYFSIQSYDKLTNERKTLCEIGGIDESGIYKQTMNGYTTSILVLLENQNDKEGALNTVEYSEIYEINDICWGSWENSPLINSYIDRNSIKGSVCDLSESVNNKEVRLDAKVDNLVSSSIYDDLNISDENGNVLARFSQGHIKTKQFDSSKSPHHTDASGTDFSISDENNNVLVRFSKGHIKTKKFDSESIQVKEVTTLIYQEQSNPFGKSCEKFFVRSGKLMLGDEVQPLIIVAGQSNADGRVSYTEAPSWLTDNNYGLEQYKVWDIESGSFKTYNVKGMTGNSGYFDSTERNKYSFDVFFAKKFLEENPTKTLYMVRQTVGGIGMQSQPTIPPMNWTWQPDTDSIVDGCQSMCMSLQQKLYNAINFANKQGIKLLPIAILWHQGENEADSGNVAYCKENLSNLISWMRGLFFAPHLPFINAELAEEMTKYIAVNDIFKELNAMDRYMKTVDMKDHTTLIDDGYKVHYDAQAIAYMGEQMYEVYKQLK